MQDRVFELLISQEARELHLAGGDSSGRQLTLLQRMLHRVQLLFELGHRVYGPQSGALYEQAL